MKIQIDLTTKARKATGFTGYCISIPGWYILDELSYFNSIENLMDTKDVAEAKRVMTAINSAIHSETEVEVFVFGTEDEKPVLDSVEAFWQRSLAA